jgi:hypothetical protein
MINLQFFLYSGESVMVYDVHPGSQNRPIAIPKGAATVKVWLGTRGYVGIPADPDPYSIHPEDKDGPDNGP